MSASPDLLELVQAPPASGAALVLGPAGSGKRAALAARAAWLLERGVPAEAILIVLPDRAAAEGFRQRLRALGLVEPALPRCSSYYGLARAALRQHWSELSGPAGFAPGRAPTFIDYELAQQLMGQIALPRLAQGAFEGLAIRPQQLVSQLLDGLNRAATAGFPAEEVEPRLREAWVGSTERLRHYARAADCMRDFRARCLERGLVDLSLQVQVFDRQIARHAARRARWLGPVRHLLVDALEESVPAAQALFGSLLEPLDSCLASYDPEAGHRIFLGADPTGAALLAGRCPRRLALPPPETSSASGALARLALDRLAAGRPEGPDPPSPRQSGGDPPWAAASVAAAHAAGDDLLAQAGRGEPVSAEAAAPAIRAAIEAPDRAAMIEAAADRVAAAVAAGTAPEQIALIAPYVDGVLAFGLREALAGQGIALEPRRRHQPLRERPVVRAALVGAALVGLLPPAEPYAVAEALGVLEPGIDPVRAQLLVDALYAPREGRLAPAAALPEHERERLGAELLARYERLRAALEASGGAASDSRFERFLGALSEALPGWRGAEAGERQDLEGLLQAARGFGRAAEALELAESELAPAFAEMVARGIVSAPLPAAPERAVLLAPAHAYLVEDRRHDLQLWLDAASPGWWSPPHQPLTNPWILSPHWPRDARWTASLDRRLRDLVLGRVVAGLARRAEQGVIVLAATAGPGGLPLEGPLWRMARQLAGPRLRVLAGEEVETR